MSNHLFPVFLKLEELNLLVVGGGAVGLEKVSAIFNNSPSARVTLVAPEIKEEIKKLSQVYSGLTLVQREYRSEDLVGMDLVIAATSLKDLNRQVREDAKATKILVNVADTPEICDFYLSSIVKKGDLKIAISTNGKSPTFAKRMRELLEEVLPDGIETILENLKVIRDQLKGDFEFKVKKLNDITSSFKENPRNEKE